MNKRNLFIGVIIVVIVFLVLLFATPLLQYLESLTPFYRTCKKVEIGMTDDQALSVMKPYEKYYGGSFDWETTDETELIYSTNNGDNCRIYIKDGEVTGLELAL